MFSTTIEKTLVKLQQTRGIARINLAALARRDVTFMSCFESGLNQVFVSIDFVSLEPSISAHFSQDRYYKYACYDGVGKIPYVEQDSGVLMIDDIYLMTASVLPSTSPTILSYFANYENQQQWVKDSEVCKNHPDIKKARKYAKPACLAFNYGCGPRKFVNMSHDAGMHVTLDEAKGMFKAYWDLFKGVKRLTQGLEAKIKAQGSLVNPFHYRLTTEPHKGYNAYIQSSASGVLDIFNYKLFRECPWAIFVTIIHDETVFIVPENKINETREIANKCLESLNKDLNFSVPMRIGFVTGKTFAELK